MSNQRKTVGRELLADLKKALEHGSPQDQELIAKNSERLINAAESYRELREVVERVVRKMKNQPNVTDKATTFDGILETLEDALKTEVDG